MQLSTRLTILSSLFLCTLYFHHASAQITTTSCEDELRPMFTDDQRRALSLVITFPNSGRVAFAKEEVSIRAMCNDPLLCGSIVHNSLMPIVFSDDIACTNGRIQPFDVEERRGLFFDPFHLNIYPSGRVTFSPSESFCRCTLQETSFNLTCHNGHMFAFDDRNNMYQFIFENITTYTGVGAPCTEEPTTAPTPAATPEATPEATIPATPEATPEVAPAKRGVQKLSIETSSDCMLSASLTKSRKYRATELHQHAYDLHIHNVGSCVAKDIKVKITAPSGSVVAEAWKYELSHERIEGLESLKGGEVFSAEEFVFAGQGPVRVSAKSVCGDCE